MIFYSLSQVLILMSSSSFSRMYLVSFQICHFFDVSPSTILLVLQLFLLRSHHQFNLVINQSILLINQSACRSHQPVQSLWYLDILYMPHAYCLYACTYIYFYSFLSKKKEKLVTHHKVLRLFRLQKQRFESFFSYMLYQC